MDAADRMVEAAVDAWMSHVCSDPHPDGLDEDRSEIRVMMRAALDAALAAAWIPVGERLPAERTDVLALDDEHGYCIAAWQREVNYVHHCDGWFDSGEGLPLQSVTHWQPLPAPPKE